MPEETLLCVGVIVGAHGVKGSVRIRSFTDDPLDVASYGPVTDAKGEKRFRLKVQGQAKETVVVAHIKGIDDRNQAEAMKGMKLYVPRSVLPSLEDEDEFYYADLIGCAVEHVDGTPLGVVKGVFDFGAGDVVEIVRPAGPALVLPFTKAVVPVVDLAAKKLLVDPPPETEAGSPQGQKDDGEDGE